MLIVLHRKACKHAHEGCSFCGEEKARKEERRGEERRSLATTQRQANTGLPSCYELDHHPFPSMTVRQQKCKKKYCPIPKSPSSFSNTSNPASNNKKRWYTSLPLLHPLFFPLLLNLFRSKKINCYFSPPPSSTPPISLTFPPSPRQGKTSHRAWFFLRPNTQQASHTRTTRSESTTVCVQDHDASKKY